MWYIREKEAKIAGLHAKARLLKRDRLCKMLYLQPENTPVHPSRHMPSSCPTLCLRGSNPPPPPSTYSTFWVPLVPVAHCLPNERSQDATGLQIASRVPTGLKAVAEKVELDCCNTYAKLGLCSTSAAINS